jgi:hypothetical protein
VCACIFWRIPGGPVRWVRCDKRSMKVSFFFVRALLPSSASRSFAALPACRSGDACGAVGGAGARMDSAPNRNVLSVWIRKARPAAGHRPASRTQQKHQPAGAFAGRPRARAGLRCTSRRTMWYCSPDSPEYAPSMRAWRRSSLLLSSGAAPTSSSSAWGSRRRPDAGRRAVRTAVWAAARSSTSSRIHMRAARARACASSLCTATAPTLGS